MGKVFTQTVSRKFHNGIEHRGVIIHQKFYVVDGFSFKVGDKVEMLESTVPYSRGFQVKKPEDGNWYLLTYSFHI